MEGSGGDLIYRYYPVIRLEELRKTTKNLSHDSRSPGRDLNLGPPEYDTYTIDKLYCIKTPER
jgi:hypothetical protein